MIETIFFKIVVPVAAAVICGLLVWFVIDCLEASSWAEEDVKMPGFHVSAGIGGIYAGITNSKGEWKDRTSEQGLRDGYGPCCLKKMREEEEYRQFMEKQYSLFDMAAEAEAAKTTAKEKFAVQPAADIFRDSEDSAEAAGKETNYESAQE